MKKRVFSIGEMARLHGVSPQSLRHYDALGLLKPWRTDPATGYRTYVLEQFATLDAILALRQFGMPLAEIRDWLATHDTDRLAALLQAEKARVAGEIARLGRIERRLDEKIRGLDPQRHGIDLRRPGLKNLPERHLVCEQLDGAWDDEVDLLIKKLQHRISDRFLARTAPVGVLYSRRSSPPRMTHVVLVLAGRPSRPDARALPAGPYASLTYRGSYDQGAARIDDLLAWIAGRDLAPAGEILEMAIIDLLDTHDERRYLTELQVAVRPLAADPPDATSRPG